jgi:acyl carrier protein
MRQVISNKVLQIVKSITGKNIENIDPEKDIKSQLTLDSIQVVELFAALELEFNVELPLEMMNLKSGKEFINRLETELSKNETLNPKI